MKISPMLPSNLTTKANESLLINKNTGYLAAGAKRVARVPTGVALTVATLVETVVSAILKGLAFAAKLVSNKPFAAISGHTTKAGAAMLTALKGIVTRPAQQIEKGTAATTRFTQTGRSLDSETNKKINCKKNRTYIRPGTYTPAPSEKEGEEVKGTETQTRRTFATNAKKQTWVLSNDKNPKIIIPTEYQKVEVQEGPTDAPIVKINEETTKPDPTDAPVIKKETSPPSIKAKYAQANAQTEKYFKEHPYVETMGKVGIVVIGGMLIRSVLGY